MILYRDTIVHIFFDKLNMKEVVMTTHIRESYHATSTLNESNYQINKLWCSLNLIALRVEYFTFEEGVPSDHRVSYVEFPLMKISSKTDNIIKTIDQT